MRHVLTQMNDLRAVGGFAYVRSIIGIVLASPEHNHVSKRPCLAADNSIRLACIQHVRVGQSAGLAFRRTYQGHRCR
jgi:hypothetical protein